VSKEIGCYIVGVYLLSGKVKRMLDSYWADYKAGKFPVYDRKAAMGTASEG